MTTYAQKHQTTYSNPEKTKSGVVFATAGQAMGLLLALTYSGGEVLFSGVDTPYGFGTKHNTSFNNPIKH